MRGGKRKDEVVKDDVAKAIGVAYYTETQNSHACGI